MMYLQYDNGSCGHRGLIFKLQRMLNYNAIPEKYARTCLAPNFFSAKHIVSLSSPLSCVLIKSYSVAL